jgi:uncharacterized protein (TIGR02217 family)
MSDAVFPSLPGLSWSVTRSPVWKTIIKESVSGVELRAALMAYPRYQIKLSFEFLRAGPAWGELQALVGFFNARRGSWDSFLFLDPTDNTVQAGRFGTGDGATRTFQLSRSVGAFVEPVTDTVGVPLVYVGGVLQSGYTVARGKVAFVTAPAAGAAITWSGQFYKRCRFSKDSTEFEEFMYQLHSAKSIELITVKE